MGGSSPPSTGGCSLANFLEEVELQSLGTHLRPQSLLPLGA